MSTAITSLLKKLDDDPVKPGTDEDTPVDDSKSIPELRGKTEEEKTATAFEWKMRGMPVPNIAKMFGVHQSTVYRWLQKHVDEYRQRLENQPCPGS